MIDRARASDVVLELILEFGAEIGIGEVRVHRTSSSKRRSAGVFERQICRRMARSGRAIRHVVGVSAICISNSGNKAGNLARVLDPLADSIPLETSTATGATCRMASPNVLSVEPPERINGRVNPCGIGFQSKTLAATTVTFHGIEQKTTRTGKTGCIVYQIKPLAHPRGLDVGAPIPQALILPLAAMELQNNCGEPRRMSSTIAGRGFTNKPHYGHEWRNDLAKRPCLSGCHGARAGRIENQPDRVGA